MKSIFSIAVCFIIAGNSSLFAQETLPAMNYSSKERMKAEQVKTAAPAAFKYEAVPAGMNSSSKEKMKMPVVNGTDSVSAVSFKTTALPAARPMNLSPKEKRAMGL